jgi:hypothetical protein
MFQKYLPKWVSTNFLNFLRLQNIVNLKLFKDSTNVGNVKIDQNF